MMRRLARQLVRRARQLRQPAEDHLPLGMLDLSRSRAELAAAHKVARRGVAFVPEDRSLFAGLTVADNLRLGTRRGRVALADVLAWFPELEPLVGRRAGLLSGGEQQMLTMGRAIASRPELLLVEAKRVPDALLPALLSAHQATSKDQIEQAMKRLQAVILAQRRKKPRE